MKKNLFLHFLITVNGLLSANCMHKEDKMNADNRRDREPFNKSITIPQSPERRGSELYSENITYSQAKDNRQQELIIEHLNPGEYIKLLSRDYQKYPLKRLYLGTKEESIEFTDEQWALLIQKIKINALTSLGIHSLEITEMALKNLNNLKELDLSGCAKLVNIKLQALNKVTIIDLSKCRRLSTLILKDLYELEKMELNKCKNLKEIEIVDCNEVITQQLKNEGWKTEDEVIFFKEKAHKNRKKSSVRTNLEQEVHDLETPRIVDLNPMGAEKQEDVLVIDTTEVITKILKKTNHTVTSKIVIINLTLNNDGLQQIIDKLDSQVIEEMHLAPGTKVTQITLPDLPRLQQIDVMRCYQVKSINVSACSTECQSKLSKLLPRHWEIQETEENWGIGKAFIDTRKTFQGLPDDVKNIFYSEFSSPKDMWSLRRINKSAYKNTPATLYVSTQDKLAAFLNGPDQYRNLHTLQIGESLSPIDLSNEDWFKLLKKLNVSTIKALSIHSNRLEKLDLSNMPQLTALDLRWCKELTSLSLINEMESVNQA